MPTLQVRFFGTLDICCDDDPLSKPATLKSQSLLAYLIHHRHQPQPRERLAGLFWGDRPEPKARHSLATALWQIRRCFPAKDPLLCVPHTVQFDPLADLWLDVAEFESGIACHDVAGLAAAVALYRGDFLDGFYDDWILNERYRLETLYSAALARLMAAQEAEGAQAAALTTAQRLLQHDRVREEAYRLAMRAYCRLGQRNAALEQYHRCREVVREELGAEPMVETTDLYEQILEGRFEVRQPVEVISAVGGEDAPPPPSGRSPLDAIQASKLVGRERELEFLWACWQQAEGGHGGLTLIRGEAGVGKTRLVEEFADRLRWQGARVLWGRCYEFERLLPYQPVREALRTLLPTLTLTELAGLAPWIVTEVARLVPEVAEQYPDLELLAPTDATREQARLFDGVAGFLSHSSAHQVLLVVIEDLHWATESTLQMLHFLARRLANQKVLLLGTLRPEVVGRRHPLRALQRQLSRDGLAHLLRLPRLSPDAVETILVGMSGAGEAVIPLAGRLHQETEGNPFFLMEIVKTLFEAGMVRLEEGTWRGDFARLSEGQLPLPASLGEAIQARVDCLDEDVQGALFLAAVLGREFDFELLNAVWGQGEEATLEALNGLLRRRLVEEGSGAMRRDYAFSHHKIQEVIYAGLPRRRRQHAHVRAGEAIERLYGATELETLAGELAHHFEQGRKGKKASGYLLQAGDWARGLYAHEEAIDYYQRALALLKEQKDYEQAARTLMRLGLTYHNAFDFRRAREAYEEGFTLWQRAGEMQRMPDISPPPAPHALRVIWSGSVGTLDPTAVVSRPESVVIEQLFSGLVALSPEVEVLPDVARTWEVSEDGRRYVFHLRDDVRWSDSVPVTAGDLEYAWKRVLDPASGSSNASLLYDVRGARAFHRGEVSNPDRVGVRALDDATLVVELEGPTGHFLQLLAYVATYPIPRHVVEAHGEAWTEMGNIVTNGPFRLEAWPPGEPILLVRYPAYHGRFAGNVQQVALTLLVGEASYGILEIYQADGADLLNFDCLAPTEKDRARHRHVGEHVWVPDPGTFFVEFNVSLPPFDDRRVRRAFVLATGREALADVVLRGYELLATGGLVPPGMPGHSAEIGLPYAPDQARQLLAVAGYPGGRGFPAVHAAAYRRMESRCQYLQAQWREILGVETAWDITEGEWYLDRLRKDPPHLLVRGWAADYPDPDNLLRVALRQFETGWRHQTYDRLLQEARRLTDQKERMKLYQQADKILIEEAAVMPFAYGRSDYLMKPWVRHMVRSHKVWNWKDVIIEPH